MERLLARLHYVLINLDIPDEYKRLAEAIDHVQITVAEEVGIEGRWGYFDESGQLRDMVQNHLMQILTNAPGNDAAIGGLKVVAENGWFALRPSGTEDIYKIYAESFIDQTHLGRIQDEAKAMAAKLL